MAVRNTTVVSLIVFQIYSINHCFVRITARIDSQQVQSHKMANRVMLIRNANVIPVMLYGPVIVLQRVANIQQEIRMVLVRVIQAIR